MGKPSRRPSRRNRHALNSPRSGLTVTVGASPTTNAAGQPTLNNELRLVRSSLLYADHVDLVAPSASWLRTFKPILGLDPDNVLSAVAGLPPETLQRMGFIATEDISLRKIRRTMRDLSNMPSNNPKRLEGEGLWRPAVIEMKEQADGVFGGANAPELELALETGDVTLVSEGSQLEDDSEQQLAWFQDRIAQALADPGTTVLLDQLTTQFLRESFAQGEGLSPVADSRFRRSATGTGLVERLPTFPDASMAEVLEVRADLAEGRAQYRAAVMNLAKNLQSAALDETLPSEIDELWYDEVRPQLEGMRKTVTASRLAKETGKRLLTEGFGIPSLLVTIAGLADLAGALPTPVALAGGLGRVAAAGAHEAFQARSAVKKHDLVYLLDLNKRLGNYGLG